MRDTYEMDMTPYDEPCAQVGSPNYAKNVKLEYAAMKAQIMRVCGAPPPGVNFKAVACPHDFGTYHQFGIVYDDDDEVGSEYMSKVENEWPANWDSEAQMFLQSNGYSLDSDDSPDAKIVLSSYRAETRKLASMSPAKLATFMADGDSDTNLSPIFHEDGPLDESEDLGGEEDPMTDFTESPGCPMCDGPGSILGVLGAKTWFRCRQCGMEFAHENSEAPHFGSRKNADASEVTAPKDDSSEAPNTATAKRDHPEYAALAIQVKQTLKGIVNFKPNAPETD